MDVFAAATLLFLIMDPLGNVPIFLSVLERVKPERRTRVVIRELLFALVILLIFLFIGEQLLSLLHLSEHAIRISGAIILFLIALKMVFPVTRSSQMDDELDGEPLLVPLAIPMVAGPSTMATILLLSSSYPDRMPEWVMALVAAWLATSIILLLSGQLKRFLGRRGLIAMERLMGMLLIGISVQMFLDGLSTYLKSNI